MTPAQLQTIEEIFYAALEQDSDDVARFLETTCEGDELLRGEVEGLLASRQRVGSFIETPAVGIATRIIRNGQADLLVGQTFGHYKISKRIGSGGMGEVYLASDMIAGRKAALKLLPMRFTGDAERLKRFQQEAHAVVALNHPNILTYERELQGVFAVQDEITRSIVDALKIKLAVSLPAHEQRNTEVYDLYLQGLFFSNKSSEEDLRGRSVSFSALSKRIRHLRVPGRGSQKFGIFWPTST